jgi:predicted metalloprotease
MQMARTLIIALIFLLLASAACGSQEETGGSNDTGQGSAAKKETDDNDTSQSSSTKQQIGQKKSGSEGIAQTNEVAPTEESIELLDQLPESTSASARGEPATIKEKGGLKKYMEYMAYQEVNNFWAQAFAAVQENAVDEQPFTGQAEVTDGGSTTEGQGSYYTSALLEITDQAIDSSCGPVALESGPLYCPLDTTIYYPLEEAKEMAKKFGAFDYANALAHEWGHHVQQELGYWEARDENNDVAFENQADCFSGVWAASYYDRGYLEENDILSAMEAQAFLGDAKTEEEGKSHGSPQERVVWFLKGFETGDASQCRTFNTEGSNDDQGAGSTEGPIETTEQASSPECASGAIKVTDDSGMIYTCVPSDWTDVQSGQWEDELLIAGETLGPYIDAAPDLDSFAEWQPPGMSFAASTAVAQQYGQYSAEEILREGFDYTENCDDGADFVDYNDGTYSGTTQRWNNCGGVTNTFYNTVAFAEDRSVMVNVAVLVLDETDEEARKVIYDSFNVSQSYSQ